MKFQTGAVFGNRYTLGERIAVGGMGEVWEATDQVLGRIVAIKLLSPALADQAGFAQRFREEARNTAALSHPNIAAVYDYGEDAGANWIVMELVKGQPLSQIIAEHGALSPERTISVISQAAHALQAAHDRGVIHRDVKPANILVKPSGEVKLTDFGISRATDAAPITRTGEVMGTAQYISPEQATGQAVSPKSDIYALGCVACEMLTGRRPFDEGSPVATAMAHVTTPPPPLPDSVPPALAQVVMSCLAKDPADRPASARALADTLRGAPTSGFPVTAPMARTERLDAATRVAPAGPATRAPRSAAPAGPATRAGATAPVAEEKERRRVNPFLWIIPLLLVLAALGFLAARSLGGDDSTPAPAPTSSTSTATSEPSESTSSSTSEAPVDTTVQVTASDYVGLTYDDARARLKGLGLKVRREDVEDSAPKGQVVGLGPSGSMNKGDVVTLRVSTGPAQTQQPEPQTSAPSSPADTTPTPEPTASEPARTPADTPSPQAPSTGAAGQGDTHLPGPAGAGAGVPSAPAPAATGAAAQGGSPDKHDTSEE